MTAPVDEITETAETTETAEVAEAVEKPPADTTQFEAAVETLLSAPAGTDTGEMVLAVRREYQEFDRSGKGVARKLVEDRATNAIMNSDVASAQTLIRLKDEMIKPLPTAGQPRAPRPPKNSTDETVASIAAIQLAYSLSMLKANENPNLDPDWQSKVGEIATAEAQSRAGAYAVWLEGKQEGEEPEASEVEKAAARISLGRAPKGQGRKPKGVEEAAKAAAEGETQESGEGSNEVAATEDYDSSLVE